MTSKASGKAGERAHKNRAQSAAAKPRTGRAEISSSVINPYLALPLVPGLDRWPRWVSEDDSILGADFVRLVEHAMLIGRVSKSLDVRGAVVVSHAECDQDDHPDRTTPRRP